MDIFQMRKQMYLITAQSPLYCWSKDCAYFKSLVLDVSDQAQEKNRMNI